jgi:hypothetical protein
VTGALVALALVVGGFAGKLLTLLAIALCQGIGEDHEDESTRA